MLEGVVIRNTVNSIFPFQTVFSTAYFLRVIKIQDCVVKDGLFTRQ